MNLDWLKTGIGPLKDLLTFLNKESKTSDVLKKQVIRELRNNLNIFHNAYLNNVSPGVMIELLSNDAIKEAIKNNFEVMPGAEITLEANPDDISPESLAVYNGELFVSDTGNNRVQRFDLSGAYLSQFGSSGAGDGQFSAPRGIAADATGIFVVDSNKEQIAVREARKLGIPVVAVVDTNCDPSEVDYVIPGNDDALRAIRLFTSKISESIVEGQQLRIAGQSDEQQATDAGQAEVPAEGVEIHAADASAIEGYVGDDGEDISMEEVLGRGKRVASEPAPAPAAKAEAVETPAV